jgi:hypothetical protein
MILDDELAAERKAKREQRKQFNRRRYMRRCARIAAIRANGSKAR